MRRFTNQAVMRGAEAEARQMNDSIGARVALTSGQRVDIPTICFGETQRSVAAV